jgi:hypothetical protein
MATPSSREARRFFRCAEQRREEARVLIKFGFYTGAVYLSGYGVECVLKALILSATPASQADLVLDGFRGGKAHDYNYLRDWYRSQGGPAAVPPVNRAFGLVQKWSTDLRYSPAAWPRPDAEQFLHAVELIIEWAEGRL